MQRRYLGQHSSAPLFSKNVVNFNYLPQREVSEKLKTGGRRIVQGQVFLKEKDWHFFYLIFSRFTIFTFRNYFKQMKCQLINTKTQVVLKISDAFYGLQLYIDQCPFVKFSKLNSCVTGKGCRENRVFLFKKEQSI